jgi:hypothetical protein
VNGRLKEFRPKRFQIRFHQETVRKRFQNSKEKAFRNSLLRKALSECGKQDLNLHWFNPTSATSMLNIGVV